MKYLILFLSFVSISLAQGVSKQTSDSSLGSDSSRSYRIINVVDTVFQTPAHIVLREVTHAEARYITVPSVYNPPVVITVDKGCPICGEFTSKSHFCQIDGNVFRIMCFKYCEKCGTMYTANR